MDSSAADHTLADGHRSLWRQRRMAMEGQSGRSTPRGHRRDSLLGYVLPRSTALVMRMPLFRNGVRNALDIALREITFPFADLPSALDGFTVLHFSDLHPSSLAGTIERAATLVAGIEVDAAVMTGDFQTFARPTPTATVAALAPLLAALRTRHGSLAVLGNHDGHDMADALEAHGIRVLLNEHAVIERGGARLVVTGTDDPVRFFTPAAVRALQHAPAGFRLALVHSPDLASVAEAAGVRLYLSGHTHGGQICLPGGRPVITFLDSHHACAVGAWRVGTMAGYTSRGTGVGLPPLRYNSRGEVALITLRRG
ncbi:MAG: metallophosphoesterase family protein [Magnetospirillum sp.]|nr:metallophosphoesterase family protein [Magnetospirillum sp.]